MSKYALLLKPESYIIVENISDGFDHAPPVQVFIFISPSIISERNRPMFSRKEIFSIPNILGYFRLLLIPVFMTIYFRAKGPSDYYIAAVVVGISSLTDMFDGLIARKFNMITELGKFIDPLADKLTQGALIVCFLNRYQWMWLLVAIYVVKEGFMAFMGLFMLRHNGRKLNGAKWFGKVSTAMLYVVLFLLLLIPSMKISVVNALIFISAAAMLLTLIGYIPVFVKMYKEPPLKEEAN